jgi:phosphate/sulfate permease
MDRHSRAKMIGEALREVGVLAAVFIPLDHFFAEKQVMPTWMVLPAVAIWGIGLWTVGMLIEEKRE